MSNDTKNTSPESGDTKQLIKTFAYCIGIVILVVAATAMFGGKANAEDAAPEPLVVEVPADVSVDDPVEADEPDPEPGFLDRWGRASEYVFGGDASSILGDANAALVAERAEVRALKEQLETQLEAHEALDANLISRQSQLSDMEATVHSAKERLIECAAGVSTAFHRPAEEE